MKSLGLQIENQIARYALVEHKDKRFRTVEFGQCDLNDLNKAAKPAQRIILGLGLNRLKTQMVDAKLYTDPEKYYGYYPIGKQRWQEFSINKIRIKIMLQMLKNQGLRVRAIDCDILALMRLARFHGFLKNQKQVWQLIGPKTVSLWQSHFSAIENNAVFYYNQELSQIDALIHEYKKSLNFETEQIIHFDDPELNPLLGLALWNVI